MKFYSVDRQTVFNSLKSSETGLSASEAEKRLQQHGKNKLAEGKKESLVKRFLKQLADPMIIVLLVAAVLSAITTVYSNASGGEGESFADVFIILFVVILNSVLGVIQESKAEEAIEALKTMSAANSKVLRDGKMVVVRSEDLVPGDIIMLEAGDAVPADARIIECASMKVEESALTGESVPVIKNADELPDEDIPLADRKNMIYMGSTVVYGRGTAVVCDTGMKTEMGKIADAITKAQDEATPLQKKLAGLSKVLTWIVLGICVLMFVVGLIEAGEFNVNVVLETFMIAVSLAVAAIPEGLAAVVTIVLSIGVTKMAKRNAIIRKLTAVETLGCAQIICSDKTGTLTQNKMTVVDCYSENEELLAKAMCLCSDAEYDEDAGESVGEPTECALVNYAHKVNLNKNELKKIAPRVGEAPFDSTRKMMSTVHSENGIYMQYTKGAPDEILKRCTSILTSNGVEPITDENIAAIRKTNKGMADKALRVLAAAFRAYDKTPESFEPAELEKDLVFIGLEGMIDPVRPEVKAAVEKCKEAGIRAVMITGDHIDTATAIASELGILTDPSQAIMGQELDKMTDEELDAVIENYSVYARVQPEHKVRIVNAWKSKGKVTAMTGDGVNDAPSIKSADIGIGMGVTGTDVTKNVADMILADDNFATIVSAVEEGRKIYSNIKKAIQFLLSSNLAEVIGVFVATLMGFTILKPVHMLWINLITDSLPALSLGMEHGEEDSMKKAPRDPKAGIFSGGVGIDIAYQGFMVAAVTLLSYFIGHFMEAGRWEITNSPDGMTMAFLTMSLAEIFQSFNMRSQRGSIFKMTKQNKWLWGSTAIALVLTTVVLYVPFLAEAFSFESISFAEYAVAFALALLVIPIAEIVKFFQRLYGKKHNK
ncbi:MAG: calcium-translocating P-type ATPase, PMCA-type [Clostridia bacterium]|nr:calcium-translocating P-type ATPase, PMCA-type [Clostridia bacterium]